MRQITILGAACLLFSAPLAAQSRASSPLSADASASIRFEIPAQPLADALREFGRQAGVPVRADLAAAAGVRSRSLAGAYTADEALARLVEGTGLRGFIAENGAAQVTRGGSAAYTLTPLTVVGVRNRGYAAARTTSATRTETPLRDVPQSVSLVTRELIADQAMQGMADVVRYIPGITMGQGEGHRDAPTIRGNSTTADFFVDGVRDDVQYFRDLYNVERVEALKGSNAMIFGRGGGGGVLNRVTKEAQWTPARVVTLEGGSFGHRRGMVDVGQGVGSAAALRFNGMYENSGGFRDQASLERYGVNPTMALAFGTRTTFRAGYELFSDRRTVDRGLPSFNGRPLDDADITTFFGNPDSSYARVLVHAASGLLEHRTRGGITLRNRTRVAGYDKVYQNSLPGAVNAAGTHVALSAYGNATDRENLFNQTDVIFEVATGPVRHTLLAGAELGWQETENYRQTGYYNNTATSFSAPLAEPTVATPITFRQSATDADNRARTTVAGVYVHDQVELARFLQVVGGVRFERFDIDFVNHRDGQVLGRRDDMISPRAGLVLKPVQPLSLYGSYSVSYLPSSGDQFSSLSATTATLKPEQFINREVGAKWDVRPSFALTGAIYRLDLDNSSAPDPADPKRTVQTGSQRTTGWELGASGEVTEAWQVVAGFASQHAEITSTTGSAKAGQIVPLVPRRTFALWNRVQLLPGLGVGVGVVRQSEMFAAIDNTVTLPGFTRADAALFLRLGARATAQLNVENIMDERYYATSHGNNNIMPGASRTVRVSVSTRR